MAKKRKYSIERSGFDVFVPASLDLEEIYKNRAHRVGQIILQENAEAEYARKKLEKKKLWEQFESVCTNLTADEYRQWFDDYIEAGGKITKISSKKFEDETYYKPIDNNPFLPDMSGFVYSDIKIIDLEDKIAPIGNNEVYIIYKNPKTDGVLAAEGATLYKDISPELFGMIEETYYENDGQVGIRKNTPLVSMFANRDTVYKYFADRRLESMSKVYNKIYAKKDNYLANREYSYEDLMPYQVYSSYEKLLEIVGERISQESLTEEAKEKLLTRLYGLRQKMSGLTEDTPNTITIQLLREIDTLVAIARV